MWYCTQRGAFRQSKTRAPKQAASAKKKLALRTQEHSRENKHLRIVSLQSTVSRYFCLSQRSMQHIALPAPKGCTPLCTDAPKLKSVRALVSECSQAPILPPISSTCSISSFMGVPAWNLGAMPMGPAATAGPGQARTQPAIVAFEHCNNTTASTVPHVTGLAFAHHSTLGATSAASQGDADESDHESSSDASSSDTHPAASSGDHDEHSAPCEDKNTPVYTGVSRSGLNGRWRAQLSTRGRTVHLGTFATAAEAARAWDRAAVQERGKAAVTNFPLTDYINADGSLKPEAGCASHGSKDQREDEGTTRGHKSFRGVYHSGTYGRWKARIVVKGHKIHLGTFASAEDAARAWDLKALEYRGSGTVTNFDPAIYASGKVTAPSEVEDTNSSDDNDSDEHYQSRATDRKRSRTAPSISPTPSEVSNMSTPRDCPTLPLAKKAHLSPTSAKNSKGHWEYLGQEAEQAVAVKAEGATSEKERESEAMASLLSLCAAAEAMS